MDASALPTFVRELTTSAPHRTRRWQKPCWKPTSPQPLDIPAHTIPEFLISPLRRPFNSQNGRFDVHAVAAGSYVLKVTSSMGPNQSVRAELRLNLTSNVYNLHLALAPEPSIPVVVQMESQPQTGRKLLFGGAGPVAVRLVGVGPGTNEAYASYDGPENQRSLTLHNVEPGRYSA